MLAYMNEQALELSIKTGFAHYFSRTKNRIWKKGETSQNTQKIISMKLDCDQDALLLEVEQIGQACHTGAKSCFFNEINLENGQICEQNLEIKKPKYEILDELYHEILDRKSKANPKTSYVASLFDKGYNAILKKIGEEAMEFALACKDLQNLKEAQILDRSNLHSQNLEKGDVFCKELSNLDQNKTPFCGSNLEQNQTLVSSNLEQNLDLQKNHSKSPKDEVIYEAADLVFHALVALAGFDIHPDAVKNELARRFGISGIEEKNARSS